MKERYNSIAKHSKQIIPILRYLEKEEVFNLLDIRVDSNRVYLVFATTISPYCVLATELRTLFNAHIL
ncbi:MAG: hypothetical protein LBU90_10305 [Bacteroidales bacterium]|jgi:hypothetical protein|nr:hypothetical protein [Bacteroidales bacterium]